MNPKTAPVLLGAICLGAAVWGSWLWDTDYYWDVTVGAFQGPYRKVQVIGSALTYGLVAALMSPRWHPVLVTFGLAGGFWTAWTIQAATTDGTGLFLAGAIMLVPALLVGGAIASACGYATRSLVQRLRPPG